MDLVAFPKYIYIYEHFVFMKKKKLEMSQESFPKLHLNLHALLGLKSLQDKLPIAHIHVF